MSSTSSVIEIGSPVFIRHAIVFGIGPLQFKVYIIAVLNRLFDGRAVRVFPHGALSSWNSRFVRRKALFPYHHLLEASAARETHEALGSQLRLQHKEII